LNGIVVSGNNVFVASYGNGTIGEYTTSGATVNASLISGLNHPNGIAIIGNDLFEVNYGVGTVGEYTTSGATINPSLISGLSSSAWGIAVEAAPEPSSCVLTALGSCLLLSELPKVLSQNVCM
jgi:hypothetical protein